MRVLSEARATLQSAAQQVDDIIAPLETRAQVIVARVPSMQQAVAQQARAVGQRIKALDASLQGEIAATERAIERHATGGARSALVAAELKTEKVLQTLELATTGLDATASQLEPVVNAVLAPARTALETLSQARTRVAGILDSGKSLIDGAEAQLEALRQTVSNTLDELETTILGGLKSLQELADAFVDGIVGTVRGLRAMVEGATAPIIAGADALSTLVNDLAVSAQQLVERISGLVDLVIGTIDAIPVSALPEPIATPTVSTLRQAAEQFGTQLQNAASAASSQLTTLATQVSCAIDEGTSQLSAGLATALQPLFDQIDALVKQIDQKRSELEAKVTTALEQLAAKRTELLDAVKSQVDAITAPITEALGTLRSEIESLGARLQSEIASALDACERQLKTLESQCQRGIAEGKSIEARISLAERQAKETFARLRGAL